MKNHVRKALALLLILSMMMGIASASEIDGITEESMPHNQVIHEDATVSAESTVDHQQDKADISMDEPATGNSDDMKEQEGDTETDTHSESDPEPATDIAAGVDTETDTYSDADASEEQLDLSCFDLSAVALSALSDGCAHDELYVYEDTSEWSYEIIDEDTHRLTYTILSRRLTCESCGKILQVVNVNKPVIKVEEHDWCSVHETPYRVKCLDCEAIKDFEKLCDHERTQMYEDGNLYCIDCGKVIVLNPEQTYCQHQNYSIYDAKKPYVECWYRSIDETQHLKITETYTFSGSDGFGICKDCGIWLGLTDGKIDAVGITDFGGEYDEAGHKTVVEEHSFVNGVCSACGQAENTCSHSATVTAENKEKTTSRVEMIEGDTEHHKVITTKHMDLFCADCGSLVAEGETVEEERMEAHTPYWGGACSVCGIGSSCQHANAVDRKYTGDSWTDYVWTGKGNQHYRIVYRVNKDCIYCYECERVGILNAQGTVSGNYVSPDFVRSEVTRNVENCYLVSNMGGEHCDYCFHYTSDPDIETPTKPTVTITHPANNATVFPNQDLKVTWDGTLLGYDGEDNYTDYEYVFCHVIVTEAGLNFGQGVVFPVYSGKNEYTIPAGTLEAGKSYKIYITFGNQSDYYAEIGATVAIQTEESQEICTHAFERFKDVLDETVAPVYCEITENTHCVENNYKRYCENCGSYIKNIWGKTSDPVVHSFGEGNVCACGFRRNCDHSSGKVTVTEIIDPKSEKYVSIGKRYHEHSVYVYRQEIRCADCLNLIETIPVNAVKTTEELHRSELDIDSFRDYCMDCGEYPYFCDHANKYKIEGRQRESYQKLDATRHIHSTWIEKYVDPEIADRVYFCPDCGSYPIEDANYYAWGSTLRRNERTIIELHTLVDGVCTQCGAQGNIEVTCDHSARNYEDVLDESVKPVYSNITETTHCVQYSYKRYCKDCGAYIKNVLSEGFPPVEHEFGEGDTCACGYHKEESNAIVFIHPSNGEVLPIANEINVSWEPVKGADGYVYTATAHSKAWGYANVRVESESFKIDKKHTYEETGIDITVTAWKGVYGTHEIIASGTITVYVKEDECTAHGHTLDAGYFKKKHPHNKVLTCTVCGYTYTLDEYGYFADCLDCICAHDEGYTIEDHPHKYAYCKKCNKRVETVKDLRIVGGFADCKECFPTELDDNTILRMLELNQRVYNRSNKTSTKTELRISMSDFPDTYGSIDCLISVSLSAEGNIILDVAFEGSVDLEDWVTDAMTKQNGEGIHFGFAQHIKHFLNEIVPNTSHVFTLTNNSGEEMNYTLQEIFSATLKDTNSHLRISGHSMGGAYAQCLAYYLAEVTGDRTAITDRMVVYTFASPVPFSYSTLEEEVFEKLNVYNFINVHDIVPDVGVTDSGIGNGYDPSISANDLGGIEVLYKWKDYLENLSEVPMDSVKVICEELNNLFTNRFASNKYNGGHTKAGANAGINIYYDSEDLDQETVDLIRKYAGMTKEELIEAQRKDVMELLNKKSPVEAITEALQYIAEQHSFEMYSDLTRAYISGRIDVNIIDAGSI